MTFKPTHEITDKQKEIFFFIVDYLEENGYQPTTREAAQHFGITRRAASDRIEQLIRKGYLVAPPLNQERSLKINNVRFEVEMDYRAIEGLDPLSEKQADVWKIIIDYLGEYGYQPTCSEMSALIGVSRASITQRLKYLMEKGYIVSRPRPSDEELAERSRRTGRRSRARVNHDRAYQIKGLKVKVIPTDDEEDG